MPEKLLSLAQGWEAEIISLRNALSSLSASAASAAQASTDGMSEYMQQLEQQLAAAQRAYALLQTWPGIG